MKKLVLICSALLIALSLQNCNKKKINELEDEIEALKNSQNQNQNQTNTQTSLLQSQYAIDVNFQGNRGYDSAAYNYSQLYAFAWEEPREDNYVYMNPNGTYYFWIERYSNVAGYRSASIEIDNYDPAVGITSANIWVYAEEYFSQSDTTAVLYVEQSGEYNTGSNDITINSFSYNESSRALNIDLTVNSTEVDPGNSSNNPAIVRMRYNGVLTPNHVVYRKGVN